MEIGGNNTGASLYAMKKAMEMPGLVLDLVTQSRESKGSVLAETAAGKSVSLASDYSSVTGKGSIIDIIA